MHDNTCDYPVISELYLPLKLGCPAKHHDWLKEPMSREMCLEIKTRYHAWKTCFSISENQEKGLLKNFLRWQSTLISIHILY